MMTLCTMALLIRVWTICIKGEKSNDETMSVNSLPLQNLDQNKDLLWITLLDSQISLYWS